MHLHLIYFSKLSYSFMQWNDFYTHLYPTLTKYMVYVLMEVSNLFILLKVEWRLSNNYVFVAIHN